MTPNEFKAWFDGLTEAFTGCPTKAQWTRMRRRPSIRKTGVTPDSVAKRRNTATPKGD